MLVYINTKLILVDTQGVPVIQGRTVVLLHCSTVFCCYFLRKKGNSSSGIRHSQNN